MNHLRVWGCSMVGSLATAGLDLGGAAHCVTIAAGALIISRVDQLSDEGERLIEALLSARQTVSAEIVNKLKGVGKRDLALIMEKLISRAKQTTEWGAPPILHALLAVTNADAIQAEALSRFLSQLPPKQIKAAIIPLLKDKPWSAPVLASWAAHAETSSQVKKAIAAESACARSDV